MAPSRLAVVGAGAAFAAITTVHFALARGTHGLHVVHVAFGLLYLVPIVGAAAWAGPRAAIVLGVVSAAAYVLHARTSWAGEPMENANQFALAAVFLFVSAVSASLVAARDRERRRAMETELRVQREAALRAIASLSTALRHRDDGTGAHCERVARLASDLGRALGLPPERVELLRLAGLMHDVGKIGVRDDVLLKPGELTEDERQRMLRHPQIAAEMLAPITGAAEIADLVLSHHECPDGTGYPRGLAGDRLSLEARALRVADAYDALVAERSYKPGLPPAEALATLRSMTGKVDARCLEMLAGLVAGARPGPVHATAAPPRPLAPGGRL
jgi:putative nucleotidyltransferase with HDIG domain